MTAYKHPVAHHWIKQTLVPFLHIAFSSTLSYPADISEEIQHSLDFALLQPDQPTDGDDLMFERIFMAIMHRHRFLAPDLTMLVDNLESCAAYLIRRAQLKGPYELLGRTDVGSDAWVEYEGHRLSKLMVTCGVPGDVLRPPVRPPLAAAVSRPTEDDIDPRLVYALPGHFTGAQLPEQLTAQEENYYRQENRYCLLAQFQGRQRFVHPYQQQQMSLQSASTSAYTPQHIHWRSSMPTQADTPPQAHRQMRVSQPRPMLPNNSNAWPQSQPAQLTSRQSIVSMQTPRFFPRLPQGQPMLPETNAQQQLPRAPNLQIVPNPYQAGQQTSQHRAPQHQQAQSIPRAHQTSQIPNDYPQTHNLQVAPSPGPTPLTAITAHGIPSSDFAHLRGNDWSNAAQQRAREVAAKITAQERDSMAQGIIQRQQTLTQQPAHAPAANTYSPANHVAQMPPQFYPASGLSNDRIGRAQVNAPSYANTPTNLPTALTPGTNAPYGSPYGPTATTNNSGWGMTPPESAANGSRAGLPTLEQVRSRYHPSQIDSSTNNASEALHPTAAQMYGRFLSQAPAVQSHAYMQQQARDQGQVPQNMLLQQPRAIQPDWANGHTNALQQLEEAAGQQGGSLAQPWGSGDAARSWVSGNGNGDVDMGGL